MRRGRIIPSLFASPDQDAIGDVPGGVDLEDSLGGDHRRLDDRTARLRLDERRQDGEKLGAQRGALAVQPGSESFAARSQAGQQIAAIDGANGDDVPLRGRRPKAAQVDRDPIGAKRDLSAGLLEHPYAGGDLGGADAKQELAEVAGLARAVRPFP